MDSPNFPRQLLDLYPASALLYMMVECGVRPAKQLSEQDTPLQEILPKKEGQWWELEDGCYQPTLLGTLIWQLWQTRWQDLVVNYDIFAGVDLAEGRFATDGHKLEAMDSEGRLIWEDLRIAVMMRKLERNQLLETQTDFTPYVLPFLGSLAEGALEKHDHWQAQISPHSSWWNDFHNTVQSHLWPIDLAYENIPYSQVIDEIMKDGYIEQEKRQEKNKVYKRREYGYAFRASEADSLKRVEYDLSHRYGDLLLLQGFKPEHFSVYPSWECETKEMAMNEISACWIKI